jgi:hypothetical protein
MQLTDNLIQATIDSISGYIIAETAKEQHLPLEAVAERFFKSHTYKLLSDKETGLYWDSIPTTLNMFLQEALPHFTRKIVIR